MPILPELYADAPESPAVLGAALRRLSYWWNALLSIGLEGLVTYTLAFAAAPDHVRKKILQPFFTTKPVGEGTGPGWSRSFDIATKGYGGTLAVRSTEGIGTEFVIRLPQA